MFEKIFKPKRKLFLEWLDDEFLSYLIEKIDEYKVDLIEKNWNDETEDIPKNRENELVYIEIFKMDIREELESRK